METEKIKKRPDYFYMRNFGSVDFIEGSTLRRFKKISEHNNIVTFVVRRLTERDSAGYCDGYICFLKIYA